ncbi:MAG: hypothetical protein DRP83_00735 [Planctomycetota bacterium]|nr:MAG: hypothetical protein DRP83_00735 [Planctomycetota bacterium]
MGETSDHSHTFTRKYYVTMPDGSRWRVPVWVIVINRALEYVSDYESLVDSVAATLEVFKDDDFIEEWARNNMDWAEVSEFATKIQDPTEAVDYQEGWVNGEHEVS